LEDQREGSIGQLILAYGYRNWRVHPAPRAAGSQGGGVSLTGRSLDWACAAVTLPAATVVGVGAAWADTRGSYEARA
jgi:hypothetical protein